MITVHGIKNCDSVKKSLKFLKEHGIEHSFRDFKISPASKEEIDSWLANNDLELLFNSKSSTYRNLNLKSLNLSPEEKIDWLCKENLLIKRPVLQRGDDIIIGFDQDIYTKELL
jgi:Spx/MgsR family transcriptional regulator